MAAQLLAATLLPTAMIPTVIPTVIPTAPLLAHWRRGLRPLLPAALLPDTAAVAAAAAAGPAAFPLAARRASHRASRRRRAAAAAAAVSSRRGGRRERGRAASAGAAALCAASLGRSSRRQAPRRLGRLSLTLDPRIWLHPPAGIPVQGKGLDRVSSLPGTLPASRGFEASVAYGSALIRGPVSKSQPPSSSAGAGVYAGMRLVPLLATEAVSRAWLCFSTRLTWLGLGLG